MSRNVPGTSHPRGPTVTRVRRRAQAVVTAPGRRLPLGYADPPRRLATLHADDANYSALQDRVWEVLHRSNDRGVWLVDHGGRPSWIVRAANGPPMVQPLMDERLLLILARITNWVRRGSDGSDVRTRPPHAVVRGILAAPDTGLPPLEAVVTTPTVAPDGSIHERPGYDAGTRTFYAPAPGFAVPAVPTKPTPADIAVALDAINEALGEFPYASAADRANACGMLLASFARNLIDGPTPLHVVEKSTPGSGATLFADVVVRIVTGEPSAAMVVGDGHEEIRKRLSAKLFQAPSYVLLDNVVGRLDAPALAAALTATYVEDRILGASSMVRVVVRCLWILTGNNPEFAPDLARRLVRIRLDARVERPENRAGFRHPDLRNWASLHRTDLVHASLVLIRAWIAAGRPPARSVPPFGGFESYAAVMGGILGHAGVNGFLGNLEEAKQLADGVSASSRAFAAGWWKRFQSKTVGSRELVPIALAGDPPLALGGTTPHARTTAMGRTLSTLRDRVLPVGGGRHVRVELVSTYQGGHRWRLAPVGENGSGKATPS